jgi:geranylgeranyl pyrophosphate synthase
VRQHGHRHGVGRQHHVAAASTQGIAAEDAAQVGEGIVEGMPRARRLQSRRSAASTSRSNGSLSEGRIAAGLSGSGIAAGQAWECEPMVDLAEYHRAKTGVLFAAAAMAGAAAAGHEPAPWRTFGARLGEAFQVADDIRDAACTAAEIGKPVGQDATLGRRSAVLDLGIAGALDRLDRLIEEALAAVPACPGAAELRAIVRKQARGFLPKELAREAA